MKVSVVIVSYNQRDLLEKAFNSVMKYFYPYVEVIIVDGSPNGSECYYYAQYLDGKYQGEYGGEKKVTTLLCEENIGHGLGMNLGIKNTNSHQILLMDSDVEITHSSVLDDMMEKLPKDAYGIGQIIEVNDSGSNFPGGIKYLHPHFALINVSAWLKYPKFIHHGAPLLKTMKAINKEDNPDLLIDFPVDKYIIHKGRGTRVLNPPEFIPSTWEK